MRAPPRRVTAPWLTEVCSSTGGRTQASSTSAMSASRWAVAEGGRAEPGASRPRGVSWAAAAAAEARSRAAARTRRIESTLQRKAPFLCQARRALATLPMTSGGPPAAPFDEAFAQQIVELVEGEGLFQHRGLLAGRRAKRAERGMAGREDDRKIGIDRGDLARDLGAVHAGHDIIEDDQARRLGGAKRGQRGLAVRGLAGLIAELVQRADNRRADQGVVVDDQDHIHARHLRVWTHNRRRPGSASGRPRSGGLSFAAWRRRRGGHDASSIAPFFLLARQQMPARHGCLRLWVQTLGLLTRAFAPRFPIRPLRADSRFRAKRERRPDSRNRRPPSAGKRRRSVDGARASAPAG